MRLYRMEVYKLLSQKVFGICAVCAVLFTVFWFWVSNVDMEIATVDGARYYGYEAVKINRQITEEYRGVLTDAKVSGIVERYGLPSEVVYDLPGWQDGNYLNTFVTDYLSDGYRRDWNNYKAPARVYAIADTELGEVRRVTGEEINFAYTHGWTALFDTLQLGMVLASILILVSVSTLFARERQTKMLPLLFTTRDGKGKEAWAKIAAGFTLTIIVYVAMVLLCLAMSFWVFGLDGGECALNMALSWEVNIRNHISYMPTVSFAWIVIGMDLLAMLLLCAITMCASAHSKSNFSAVTMAAVLWGVPIPVRMLFGGLGVFLSSCMPLFLVMTYGVYDAVSWGWVRVMIYPVAALTLICTGASLQTYRRQV